MRVRMIFAFAVLFSASMVAQTFRGTILGTVTDASGAVISGANVMVKNVATGLERSTQTSVDGSYSVGKGTTFKIYFPQSGPDFDKTEEAVPAAES
ncbi:MAG: carboxypeptidase-like regulatory domain-containing protein, partial [Acidobacteriia bacterium]|nr:carboxypeptidase-like regulatory domain-containing protein [Terriglobia bacterium]